MTASELELLVEFRNEVPAPDEAAAERIYGIATAARRPSSRLIGFRAAGRRRLIVAVAAAALAVAGAASALAFHYLGPSPGFSAGFSAFDQLPPARWPGSVPRVALERSAAYVGVTPDQFLQRLRVLRTGLTLGPGGSQGQGELYAYVSGNGLTACMFLTGQSGTCFKADYAPHVHGVLPEINPGYPGQTPALMAIVADSVTSVELDVSGRPTTLPIINNSVYASLAGLRGADRVELHVTYDDGSTALAPLPNPLRTPS
jgi:hypothetical protein